MVREELEKYISCEVCDEDLCKLSFFTCNCEYIDIKGKCALCNASGYNCEVANSFSCICPFIRD